MLWNIIIVSSILIIMLASTSPSATCKEGEFYPNTKDKTKFYRCVYGELVDFECGPGTIWNEKLTTCVHGNNKPEKKYDWEDSEKSETTSKDDDDFEDVLERW